MQTGRILRTQPQKEKTMTELLAKQQKFSVMVASLIKFLTEKGYGITLGEAWRTPEQAALNAAKGIGIKNSLHADRLAIDLNLFLDGVFLRNPESYQLAGDYWVAIGGTWGGRFGDANHFSLPNEGRK